MRPPSPAPIATRYNKGSKMEGRKLVFQVLKKTSAFRRQTNSAPESMFESMLIPSTPCR